MLLLIDLQRNFQKLYRYIFVSKNQFNSQHIIDILLCKFYNINIKKYVELFTILEYFFIINIFRLRQFVLFSILIYNMRFCDKLTIVFHELQ